jgi:Zn-finger nucleic acid-binding protein
MNRSNYGSVSGVLVDVCSAHGVWMDAGELERISEWVASGGGEETRRYRRELDQLNRRTAARLLKEAEREDAQARILSRMTGHWVGFSIAAELLRLIF